MDTPLDLDHANRPDLAEVMVAQRDRIADRERRLACPQEAIANLQTVITTLTQRVGRSHHRAGAPAAGDDGRPGRLACRG